MPKKRLPPDLPKLHAHMRAKEALTPDELAEILKLGEEADALRLRQREIRKAVVVLTNRGNNRLRAVREQERLRKEQEREAARTAARAETKRKRAHAEA